MNRRTVLFLFAFAAAMAAAGGITASIPSAAAAAPPIAIGFVADFTGNSKDYTANAFQAAALAVEEINADGGLMGRRVVMVVGDAGESPERHYDTVKRLVTFGWFSIVSDNSGQLLPEGIWKLSRGPFNYLADKHPVAKRFVDRFHRRTGTYPFGFTVCVYDAFVAWRQAVEAADSAAPSEVAAQLRGMSFSGLRGESRIRAVDGQMACPTFFGRVTYRSAYQRAVIDAVVEIPAEKTWLTIDEVLAIRAKIGAQAR